MSPKRINNNGITMMSPMSSLHQGWSSWGSWKGKGSRDTLRNGGKGCHFDVFFF